MLLRIEDIDLTRRREHFEIAIYEDLEWLGFTWETPVRRQSDHLADYAAALDALRDEELVYPSFMTRGDVKSWVAEHEADGKDWPRDPDGAPQYPGLEKQLPRSERNRRISEGVPHAWRLDMEAALSRIRGPVEWIESGAGPAGETGRVRASPALWGDVVLARSDAPSSYNLAVTVDDAIQGVTHVVRGRDLYHATSVQRLLQELLGFAAPAYNHHDLILDTDGLKLSKSRDSTALRALREAGETSGDIMKRVGLSSA